MIYVQINYQLSECKYILCKPVLIYLHVVSYPNTKATCEKISKQLVINKNDRLLTGSVGKIAAKLHYTVITIYMHMVINPNCNKTFNTQIDIPLYAPFENVGHPYIIYDIQIDLAISPSRLH